MKLISMISVVFFCYKLLPAGEKVTDYNVGYSVQLPGAWIHEVIDATHHQFYDTTYTCKSFIAIKRVDFDSAEIFSTANEWTRANFLGNKFYVEADLQCVLSFYDSVNVWQNDTLWAADAYSYFFDDSTGGENAEYIRHTAIGTRGYEIYATGEAQDMDSNLVFYVSIIDSITILDSAAEIGIKSRLPSSVRLPLKYSKKYQVNALGRAVAGRPHNLASQLIIAPRTMSLWIRK